MSESSRGNSVDPYSGPAHDVSCLHKGSFLRKEPLCHKLEMTCEPPYRRLVVWKGSPVKGWRSGWASTLGATETPEKLAGATVVFQPSTITRASSPLKSFSAASMVKVLVSLGSSEM